MAMRGRAPARVRADLSSGEVGDRLAPDVVNGADVRMVQAGSPPCAPGECRCLCTSRSIVTSAPGDANGTRIITPRKELPVKNSLWWLGVVAIVVGAWLLFVLCVPKERRRSVM